MAVSLPSTRDDAIVAQAEEYAQKFHGLGMLAEAEKFYSAILAAKPDHFDALHQLAVLRRKQGDSVEALRLIGEALRANSRSVDSTRSFGAALEALGRHEEARAAFDKAAAIRKLRAEALFSRGVALVTLRRIQEALAAFDEALASDPDLTEAHVTRGVMLTQLGRFQEGLAALDLALEGEPDHLMALGSRVTVLAKMHRHADVLDACEKVLALDRGAAETLYLRAGALWMLGRSEEALESYEQAWELGHTRSLSMLVLYRLMLADWKGADKTAAALRRVIDEGGYIYPFAAVALGLAPRDQHKAAMSIVGAAPSAAPSPHPIPARSDKLRIAYVSSDYRRHPVAYAIAELFERHDRSRFEIIGLSLCPDDASPVRRRIFNACHRYQDVYSETDEGIARLMHDLGVHVVVDLNGPTEGWRPGIFAHRAAPIQVLYLGYPATSGAHFIDYVLADETVLPFDQQPFFAEKIVHLPGCYHANDTARQISPDTPSRRELSLPDEGAVFCCFNKSFKISAPVFDVWMRLLARLPDSVLWLAETNDAARANLRREAAARGIDPQRLIFAPYAGRIEDHLARHRAADLFLDTLPYNAHSTACDALWSGLPVVTCAGTAFAGRVGASMLKAAGLPELVTVSLEDYEALALKLATDRDYLSSIQRKLADNRPTCALFDGDRFRRGIESAYETMWDICQRGESPRSFRVEPNP
jgi:predicted O-linked N-acetylglucosamine transferase (SPINDLY family)